MIPAANYEECFEWRYFARRPAVSQPSLTQGGVHLPRGVIHTHRAGGGAPAKALVIQAPAGIERFIEEAGKPATDPSARPAPPEMPELEKIVAIAQKHGIEVPRG